jgi:hypothetical protein
LKTGKVFFALLALGVAMSAPPAEPAKRVPAARIDRRALVQRHNVVLRSAGATSPLSVGNGDFTFTADVTGLQTFYDDYRRNGMPVETLAGWLWHAYPNPHHYRLADTYKTYSTNGRPVGYPADENAPAASWLRENPQRFPPGQVGFLLKRPDGAPAALDDLKDVSQTLDLWTGILASRYSIAGTPVEVTTICHPQSDTIAVRVNSALLSRRRIAITLAFPANHRMSKKLTPALDWSAEGHETRLVRKSAARADFLRTIDSTTYTVSLAWSGAAKLAEVSKHHFQLTPAGNAASFEFVWSIARTPPRALPSFAETKAASVAAWEKFWQSGGAIDFSGSSDPRAFELERRIVLSQYLTRMQSAGTEPPQESGLTVNTWYGKFHTEMVWWHTAHFALWNRPEFAELPLQWFQQDLPAARATAKERGLRGARWPKMAGPEGRESPGGNALIFWNQPQPIYLAELVYRARPSAAILEKYKDVVLETAECMASLASWDASRRRYVLGPPLWISQEIYDPARSRNPAFELSYWAFGLKVAQQWRERLGMNRNPQWDEILQNLSPLPTADGLYVALESTPDTFTNRASRHDHPTMLAPLGLLPGDLVDRDTMRATLHAVLELWDWETKIWGWDYPLIAMTAARLGEPEAAVDILLRDGPNNRYLANGHVPQRGNIAAYLPANGALLSAAALMAAGWDGSREDLPGFPKDGKWQIRYEGLEKMP